MDNGFEESVLTAITSVLPRQGAVLPERSMGWEDNDIQSEVAGRLGSTAFKLKPKDEDFYYLFLWIIESLKV